MSTPYDQFTMPSEGLNQPRVVRTPLPTYSGRMEGQGISPSTLFPPPPPPLAGEESTAYTPQELQRQHQEQQLLTEQLIQRMSRLESALSAEASSTRRAETPSSSRPIYAVSGMEALRQSVNTKPILATTAGIEASVKKFNGKDELQFPSFRKSAEVLFHRLHLSELASGSVLRPGDDQPLADQQVWDARNSDLYTVIHGITLDDARTLVEQHHDARSNKMDGLGAWTTLQTKYLSDGLARKLTLVTQLLLMSPAANEDMDVFLARIDGLNRHLLELDIRLDPILLLAIIMLRLPNDYDPLITTLNALPVSSLTYEVAKQQLKSFVRIKEAKKKSQIFYLPPGPSSPAPAPPAQVPSNPKPGRRNPRKGKDGKDGKKGKPIPPTLPSPPEPPSKSPKPKESCGWCGRFGHSEDGLNGCNQKKAWLAKNNGQTPPVDHAFVITTNPSATLPGDVVLHTTHGSSVRWLLDSCASTHIAPDMAGISDFVPTVGDYVYGAGDQPLSVIGIGTLTAQARTIDGNLRTLQFTKVKIVPTFSHRILCVKAITGSGYASITTRGATTTLTCGKDPFPAYWAGELMAIDLIHPLEVRSPLPALLPASSSSVEKDVAYVTTSVTGALIHARCGHRNNADVRLLAKTAGTGIPSARLPDDCDICAVAKSKRTRFSGRIDDGVTRLFERVFVDTLSSSDKDVDGAKYALGALDAYSRMGFVFFMDKKSQTPAKLKAFVQLASSLGYKVKQIWSDNGSEYYSTEVEEFFSANNIHHTGSGPYAPQQNGMVERWWDSIVNMARCLLEQSGFPKDMWAEMLAVAVYLTNRMPATALNGKSPYEVFYGQAPKLDHLRVIGCAAYPHINTHQPKFHNRAYRGILVGYHNYNRGIYRIYDMDAQIVRPEVRPVFIESIFPAKLARLPPHFLEQGGLAFHSGVSAASQPVGATPPSPPSVSQPVGATPPVDVPTCAPPSLVGEPSPSAAPPPFSVSPLDYNLDEGLLLRSRRGRRVKPRQSSDYVYTIGDSISLASVPSTLPREDLEDAMEYALVVGPSPTGDPATFLQAIRGPAAPQWWAGMVDEIESHRANQTWTLVPKSSLPPGTKLVGSRWVYKGKMDASNVIVRHKARVVAQGYTQEPGRDYTETYAPVARMTTIRTTIATAAAKGHHIHQVDIKTAFLNAELDVPMYIKQPQGFEKYGPNGEEMVCKLNKSIYGLKQSPHLWNKVADEWFKQYGLEQNKTDPCLYTKKVGNDVLIVIIYVDDIIVSCKSLSMIENFKKALGSRFVITDLGEIKWILGMEVTRLSDGSIKLSQSAYIKRMLERFDMVNCKPLFTPLRGPTRRNKDSKTGKPNTEYLSMVGSLNYAACSTRPDIAEAVQEHSRHNQAPTAEHFKAVRGTLAYLAGTIDEGIVYTPNGTTLYGYSVMPKVDSSTLVGYADSDYAGDVDTRRSTTGYVYLLSGGAISWSSRLQPTVSHSSTEAELKAADEAARECTYMRSLLKGFGLPQQGPTIIFEDNQGCIKLIQNPIYHSRTKHIDVRYFYIRELIEAGILQIEYIPTEHQLADLLTKPTLLRNRIEMLRKRMMNYKA